MSIFEIQGGPINHRHLMQKPKNELANMILRLLHDQPPKLSGFNIIIDPTIPANEIQFRDSNGKVLAVIKL